MRVVRPRILESPRLSGGFELPQRLRQVGFFSYVDPQVPHLLLIVSQLVSFHDPVIFSYFVPLLSAFSDRLAYNSS